MGGVAEKLVRLSGDIQSAAGNKLPGLLLRAKMPGDTGFKGIIFQFKLGQIIPAHHEEVQRGWKPKDTWSCSLGTQRGFHWDIG